VGERDPLIQGLRPSVKRVVLSLLKDSVGDAWNVGP
jgi:hypothetical protein